MAPYNIFVECDFAELWRYNIAIQGEITLRGERRAYLQHFNEVAPVGSNLTAPPQGYTPQRYIELGGEEGDALRLNIYLLPHTLPLTRIVRDAKPFEFHVTITHGDEVVYNRRHMINQWSGESISIELAE